MSASASAAEEPGPQLSLRAQLFLVAIDPESGRLVKRRRLRFRRALAQASGGSGPGTAIIARRAAIAELRAAGLLERSWVPGRYPIVVGSKAWTTLGRLRRASSDGEFRRPGDATLLVLLVWTGVFAQRVARSERRAAVSRVRRLLEAPPAQFSELPAIAPVAYAAGQIAFHQELDLLHDVISDLLGGGDDDGGFDGGFDGFDGGGFDGGGGDSFDGGGGDSGGGGGDGGGS